MLYGDGWRRSLEAIVLMRPGDVDSRRMMCASGGEDVVTVFGEHSERSDHRIYQLICPLSGNVPHR
jgi:hypothetical protein